MRDFLIDAIRTGDPEIMELFAKPFCDDKNYWADYIRRNFGSKPNINIILDDKAKWGSARFQALYIACWIYHPLEKGSFMIQLNEPQRANAEASASKLTFRKSSHLSGTSRSARGGHDFKFIKGYGELLVIVEGNYLFLKMEGHKASSPSHLKSWVTKIRTGAGETSNQHLNDLSQNPKWGIQQRGAENYSKSYKKLIKELGFSGKTVTFAQVLGKLCERIGTVTMPTNGNWEALSACLDLLLKFGRFSGIAETLSGAEGDLRGMLRELKEDNSRIPSHDGVDHMGVDRIFREIRANPESISSSLFKFYEALTKADSLGMVRAFNA